MKKITPGSRLTFGKCKGKKLRECDTGYLEWLVGNLADTDFLQWSQAAAKELEVRKEEDARGHGSLEEQADRILREAGFKP